MGKNEWNTRRWNDNQSSLTIQVSQPHEKIALREWPQRIQDINSYLLGHLARMTPKSRICVVVIPDWEEENSGLLTILVNKSRSPDCSQVIAATSACIFLFFNSPFTVYTSAIRDLVSFVIE
jgi:hypothetical protein